MAWLDGPDIISLIDGADYLFSNDYEDTLITQKTGWSHDEIVSRVGVRVMTRGKRGARIEVKGEDPVDVAIAPETAKLDPTGVGDAFRAGFIAGLSWGLVPERCAQIGSLLSSYVIAVVGTQEYRFAGSFADRFARAYGDDAAAELVPHLSGLRL